MVLAELIDYAIRMQISTPARDELEQPDGDGPGKRPRRVDERGDEGRLTELVTSSKRLIVTIGWPTIWNACQK
jgi:hypothetical protein